MVGPKNTPTRFVGIITCSSKQLPSSTPLLQRFSLETNRALIPPDEYRQLMRGLNSYQAYRVVRVELVKSYVISLSGGSSGGKGGASVPRFGLHPTLRNNDDKLNGTPLSGYKTKKLLLWLTLECFRRKFVRKRINWTGRAGS